jgi:hypothetical protein
LPRTPKASKPEPDPEPHPSRVVVTHPPSEWYARLRQELAMAGVDHDKASLISRRVLSALIPQHRKLELVDREDV